jgi:hypothetical protein
VTSIWKYLKRNDPEFFKRNSLELPNLFMGTEDVTWNPQKIILGKKYLGFKDPVLVEMCDKAYVHAKYTIYSFIVVLILFITSGLTSS